jgi:hypothetical protein
MLKKATILRQGYGWQASGVLGLALPDEASAKSGG